jgi:hypothetical protein
MFFFDSGALALLWYIGRTLSIVCYLKIKKLKFWNLLHIGDWLCLHL